MTKKENILCESLMNQAINRGKEAEECYNEYEKLLKQNEVAKAEIQQRRADQLYGECIGINQVLSTLKFKHNRMTELSKLL